MADSRQLVDVQIINRQAYPIYYNVRIADTYGTTCRAIVFGGPGFFKTDMNTYFDLLDSDHEIVQKLIQASGTMHGSAEGFDYNIDGIYTGKNKWKVRYA